MPSKIEKICTEDWFYEGVTSEGTVEQMEQKIEIIAQKVNELVEGYNQLLQEK